MLTDLPAEMNLTTDLARVARVPRAIVYLAVEWSARERLARPIVAAAVRALSPDPPFAFFTVEEDGPATAGWLRTIGWEFARGAGSVLWLERGRIVASKMCGADREAADVGRTTGRLWEPPSW